MKVKMKAEKKEEEDKSSEEDNAPDQDLDNDDIDHPDFGLGNEEEVENEIDELRKDLKQEQVSSF